MDKQETQTDATMARVPPPPIGSTCSVCGTATIDRVLCHDCCKKAVPEGPPLKRLRRYGFKVSYHQRQCMRLATEITGAIPTEVDVEGESIKMSHRYVACDGKTYVGHEWITQGGSSISWSEPYPSNSEVTHD